MDHLSNIYKYLLSLPSRTKKWRQRTVNILTNKDAGNMETAYDGILSFEFCANTGFVPCLSNQGLITDKVLNRCLIVF